MTLLPWWLLPFVAASIAFFTAMVGVSGAFLLLPFQLSVLGIASPSASATNLVFNLVAIPPGLWRYGREGRIDWRLASWIALASVPGVLLGWWLRVEWLADVRRFEIFVAIVLAFLAVRLLHGRGEDVSPTSPFAPRWGAIASVAFLVGIVGGAYGIGGGALMAPVLVGWLRMPVHHTAGATLFATFATSVMGVMLYQFLPAPSGVIAQPDWAVGLLFGVGGAVGMYFGARAQKRVPARALERGLAAVLLALAAFYLLPRPGAA